jgi:hypothetical protein
MQILESDAWLARLDYNTAATWPGVSTPASSWPGLLDALCKNLTREVEALRGGGGGGAAREPDKASVTALRRLFTAADDASRPAARRGNLSRRVRSAARLVADALASLPPPPLPPLGGLGGPRGGAARGQPSGDAFEAMHQILRHHLLVPASSQWGGAGGGGSVDAGGGSGGGASLALLRGGGGGSGASGAGGGRYAALIDPITAQRLIESVMDRCDALLADLRAQLASNENPNARVGQLGPADRLATEAALLAPLLSAAQGTLLPQFRADLLDFLGGMFRLLKAER